MSSRIVPNILDPLTSSALNKLHEPTPPTLKRKRSDDDEIYNAAGQLATSSIVIRVSISPADPQSLTLARSLAHPNPSLDLIMFTNTNPFRHTQPHYPTTL
jgi:hypothetical protein